jgi:hypothetical protein
MAALFNDYRLIINLSLDLNDELKTSEANRIFKFIKTVQGSEYKPNRISFWYNAPKTAKNKDGQVNIGFNNWMDITMVEQVMEKLETELERKS